MTEYIVKVNTISARGLPAVLQEHIQSTKALRGLTEADGSYVVIYPGAFNAALNTIAWFMYGERL